MYSDMHTKWKNFFVNAFFWMLVFALKIPFDYFVIHKPLVKPVRAQCGGFIASTKMHSIDLARVHLLYTKGSFGSFISH